jgi:hypothetical protein
MSSGSPKSLPKIISGWASVAALSLHCCGLAHSANLDVRAVILSNFPQIHSAGYRKLSEAAGHPKAEMLEMTKAVVWEVPLAHWDRFIAAAKRQGVTLTLPDSSSMSILSPMEAKAMTATQSEMMHDAMSFKAAMGMSMMRAADPATEEYALTHGIHENTSSGPQPEIIIPLNGQLSVKARRTSINKTAHAYAWHGVITETGEPVTILWWPTGKTVGRVMYKRQIYAIRDLGGNMHGILALNPQAFPEEHAPMSAELKAKMKKDYDPLLRQGDASMLMPGHRAMPEPSKREQTDSKDLRDAAYAATNPAVSPSMPLDITPAVQENPAKPVTIRIIVAYTAAAARHYMDIQTDLIELAIEEANQSFRNSGLGNVQLLLAHAYQTTYVESDTHFEHVFRFANDHDGYMDEVHALRKRYAADAGILIVDDANGCGLAAEVYARPERAFAVVNHECATNMYSLGHEIGHLIGARHDAALDDTPMPFNYGHGFVAGKAWRTMMSYKDSCDGCVRLPVWSNPNALVHDMPAGNATSDNARVIAEEAARVAGFHKQLR